MLAKQFMSSQYVALNPDTTMEKAVSRFLNENIEILPVVDSNHLLIGVVGESDLLAGVADVQRRQDPISLYMKRQFVSIEETAPLETVIDQFILHRVRCLPVVSQRILVGMIQRREVLRYLSHDTNSIFSIG